MISNKFVFVENVLLHGQNGKKSKKVRVLGIFKSDPKEGRGQFFGSP